MCCSAANTRSARTCWIKIFPNIKAKKISSLTTTGSCRWRTFGSIRVRMKTCRNWQRKSACAARLSSQSWKAICFSTASKSPSKVARTRSICLQQPTSQVIAGQSGKSLLPLCAASITAKAPTIGRRSFSWIKIRASTKSRFCAITNWRGR